MHDTFLPGNLTSEKRLECMKGFTMRVEHFKGIDLG